MKKYFETTVIPVTEKITEHPIFGDYVVKQINERMLVASNIENGYVQVIHWKKELGAQESLDGYIQVTARPYKQGYGCDGTTDSNVHLIAKTVCEKIGIDYIASYEEAYCERVEKWLIEAKEWLNGLQKNDVLISETIIPEVITLDVLRLVLSDLYQLNYRILVEVLTNKMVEKGYLVEDFFNHEDELKSWKFKVKCQVKAYVLGEHTLGLVRNYSANGMYFERLNGLGTRGGMALIDGPRWVMPNDIRPANLKDFETFKVKYHSDYGVEN